MANPRKKPATRPRWLRYSLRGLLVLTLLISIGLAVYVWLFQELHQQQAIAAELTELGCTVEWDKTFDPALLEMTERVSTTPQWLIDLLGEDPHRQLNAVSCTALNDAEQLQSILDNVAQLPYATYLFLVDQRNAIGDVRLHAQPGLRTFSIVGLYTAKPRLTEISANMPDLQHIALAYCQLQVEDIAALSELHQLRALELNALSPGISSDCLPIIVEMSSLVRLQLSNARITDANLELLERLPELRRLSLRCTDITDAAIPKLAKLTSLQELDLSRTVISNNCLPDIAEMSSLVSLDISRTNINDTNLESLQKLPKLATLSLSKTLIADAAVPKLGQLKHLEDLDLSFAAISGAGLSVFANHANLRLDLSCTHIGDDCVDELSQCKQLKVLGLRGTNFTPAGLARLKQALPRTEIIK